MPAKKAEKLVPLMVRLPEELHKRLTGTAEKAGRSLNQELIERLQRSFVRDSADELLAQANDDRLAMVRLYNIVAEKLTLPTVLEDGTLDWRGNPPIMKRKKK